MSAPLHLVPDRMAPLAAYRPKAALEIKLDANEAPRGPSPEFQRDLAARLAALPLHRYPDPRASGLRAALAARFDDDPEAFVIGCGSDEIISLLYLALSRTRLANLAPVVLYPAPSFVMYRFNAITHGWVPIPCPLLDGWGLDVAAMVNGVQEHEPNIIFLASPNNPTGNAFPEEEVRTVIEAAPRTLVVIDEAYAAFAGESLSAFRHQYPHVAIMRTLSKVGLAALRVGWLQAHPDLAGQLEKVRQPFNLSSLAQESARLALTDHWSAIEDRIAAVVSERRRVTSALSGIDGLQIYPSDANFLLARFQGGTDAVRGRLARAGISVRAFSNEPRLAEHLRISIGTADQNTALITAVKG